MTSKERFARMFNHQEADRVPIIDSPWGSTIKRWHDEGMPAGTDYVTYFDLDRLETMSIDSSPRFEHTIIEDNDEYTIFINRWGTTVKQLKDVNAEMPEFLDYKVKDRESWAAYKARMDAALDRIPWETIRANYPKWQKEGAWIHGHIEFGFNLTSAYTMSMEDCLIAMYEDPEWCYDIYDYSVRINLKMLDALWDAGYIFDALMWYDDMGYKGTAFFSNKVYREVLAPSHQLAIDWAHAHGIKAHLHSCGNVMQLVPEFVKMGVDGLNPLEIKAGMDPVKLKAEFGDRLLFHGGLNAMLWTDIDQVEAEMRRLLPVMKQDGGFIFSSDHSVPVDVSLQNFGRIVDLAKELGAY